MSDTVAGGRLCLFGAGEHARVVAEAAVLAGVRVFGCWAPQVVRGMIHLGDDDHLERELPSWSDAQFHLALAGVPGDGLRQRVLSRFSPHRLHWLSLVHPSAWVSPSAHLGDGVFIGPRALVHAGASIGNHAIINSAAVVEHDVAIGAGAHLAPGSICGGGAHIGAWAFCGLGSVIRDHIRVGDGAVVGMGAVVIRDLAARMTAVGNPARPR